MKQVMLLLLSLSVLFSCKKSDPNSIADQTKIATKSKINFNSPAYIDPQILQLLAKDLKKDGMEDKARQLLSEYDNTGHARVGAASDQTARDIPAGLYLA